jgi:hypothetical protein
MVAEGNRTDDHGAPSSGQHRKMPGDMCFWFCFQHPRPFATLSRSKIPSARHLWLRVCKPVRCDDVWQKNSKLHHTTRAGLLNLRRSGIE